MFRRVRSSLPTILIFCVLFSLIYCYYCFKSLFPDDFEKDFWDLLVLGVLIVVAPEYEAPQFQYEFTDT